MELATVKTDYGTINFSKNIIEALIRLVLQEIEGIVLSKKLIFKNTSNKLNKKNEGTAQDIRIEIKPNSIIVSLFLTINYGIRIPDLTWEIQAKVKEKLREVTELDIDIINVHIEGIRYPNKYRKKDKLIIPDIFVKIF